jgi:hypothetical protein
MNFPCSPHETTGGIVYFRRMIEKIRLMAAGSLHPDLQANLGTGFDERCVNFLGVSYAELADAVRSGLSDDDALAWCFAQGRRPGDEEIEIWNGFMRKRGWRDAATPMLVRRKGESCFTDRDDIQTMFDYIDADEGRPPQTK